MSEVRQHIVSFSGGKDSTALLLMMIERGMPIDRIINVDTSKEFPQMYTHIEQVRELIKPMRIETVRLDFDYWFKDHVRVRGVRRGQRGFGFPESGVRWCTALKQEAFAAAMNNKPYNPRRWHSLRFSDETAYTYLGIAFDEVERASKNKNNTMARFPLIDWKVTSAEALQYCYDKGFTWGGLYERFSRVSCWCCPLQRINELRILYNHYPELWRELEDMQQHSFRGFRNQDGVAGLAERFKMENAQQKLFADEELI